MKQGDTQGDTPMQGDTGGYGHPMCAYGPSRVPGRAA